MEIEITEVELVAVRALYGKVFHALDIKRVDNHGWVPGGPGKTLCGRNTHWGLMGEPEEGVSPCRKCDEKAAMAAVLFETAQAVEDMHTLMHEQHRQHDFMRWMTYGVEAGYVTQPLCSEHSPESDEMIEAIRERHCPFALYIIVDLPQEEE